MSDTRPEAGPVTALLPELVARQAGISPDAVAVTDPHRQLAYLELDRRADQVASHLRRIGGRRDALVAVCLHRSVDLAVALLGVWRAGMAYAPLDPAHPEDRLAWQLADTGAEIVLTEQALVDAVGGSGSTAVCLDSDWDRIANAADTAPGAGIAGADAAAYAIYTSGSTGRPKGVLVSHQGITNRVLWTVRTHEFSAADRVLQKTAMTFDAACWEVFAPLVSGGTVVMAPAGVERDPAALVRALADYEITVLQVVPSVLRLLVDEPDWRGCGALRLVFSAGEPLDATLCQRLLERVKVEIWNTYGPTECAIDVSAHRFDPIQESGPVPIGRPIDNTRLLVLDPGGDPVPVGVPGELHIGGDGVARGYIGRPELTATSFVPAAYGPPGSRLYRTGDLVRWHKDGTLEYLGRQDSQIKINGVRVEPAEVEAALLRHPAVGSAAVKSFTDASHAHRLAAYVLKRDIAEPESLRGFLRAQVPEALVPSVFVAVDAFPMTTSGKVDRAALPDPEDGSGRPPYRPPRTAAERLVAEAWSELLEADRVGVHDNFFQLGGSSLLMTRLAARLGMGAGREVAVPDLFVAPTVEEQARLVEAAGEAAAPIPTLPRDRPLPLSFGQRRQWVLDRLQPGSLEWLAPMFLSLPSHLAPETVQRALDVLQARHESLRTRYVTAPDGEPMQVVDAPASVRLRVVDDGGREPAAHFQREFSQGFDLAQGPLLRALLVRTSGPEQLLLLTMHHIACDGWSTVIIERELRELCAAFHEGREPDLPALPAQYADFATWQRERFTDEVCERDLGYWREALAGLATLELPLDRPRPTEWDARGGLVPFRVPAGLAERVVGLGRQHGATPFMTLLTAFGILLSRYSGQVDVPVGIPVSGRTHSQTDDMVGFFLNSLVFRCDLSGAPGFLEALGRVRDMSMSSFAHQSLPFERLVEDLAPERDLSRNPLYQVEFDMRDEGWTGTAVDTGGMAAFQQSWQVAKSDICLYLQRLDDGSLAGAAEYAQSLFDRSTIERFVDHYVRLLEVVAAAPEMPMSAPQFLSPHEREQLLTGWQEPHSPDAARRVRELLLGSVRVYLLDRYGNLAPVGVRGELHVGGPAIGDGAVGRLGLGDEWFVPDPFGPPDARLYRSGEFGRWRADGSLEIFDRADNQPVPPDGTPAGHGSRTDPADEAGGQARRAAEQAITQVWTELLGVEVECGVSFFGLGGNSILAIRMISRIREEFGVDVSIRAFFERPTVASLAEEVEAQIRAELAELPDSEVLAQASQQDASLLPYGA